MASKSTSLAIGGSFTASVMALAAAGYVLLGGNTITDKSQNSAPGRATVDSSANVVYYDKYQEQQITTASSAPSGATTSGAMANQQAAFILNDSNSGSVIDRIEVSAGNKANAQNFFVAITPTTKTGTGTNGARLLMARKSFGTGSVYTWSGSEAIWPKSNYLLCITASGSNAIQNGADNWCRVWYHQKAGTR